MSFLKRQFKRRSFFSFFTSLFLFLGSTTILFLSLRLKADPRGYGTHEQLFLPPCFFYFLTHYPCPACGLTTSFAAMAHGDFLMAFQANALGPLLFLFTIFLAAASFADLIFQKKLMGLLDGKYTSHFLFGFIAFFLLNWIWKIIRSIP